MTSSRGLFRLLLLSGFAWSALGCSKTLVDKEDRLLNDHWSYYEFELAGPAQVTLEFGVIDGKGITTYLLAAEEAASFVETQTGAFRSSFKHYSAFHNENQLKGLSFGDLQPGKYVLAAKEGGAPGETGAATARLKIKAR